MATLLALVTVKYCSDITCLGIENNHLFWCHSAIFVPASGGMID